MKRPRAPAGEVATEIANPGCLDSLVHCARLGGWLARGWLTLAWGDGQAPTDATLTFMEGATSGPALLSLFAREDVRDFGQGFILFLAGERGRMQRDLRHLGLSRPGLALRLPPGRDLHVPAEDEAIAATRMQLADAQDSPGRAGLLKLLSRPAYDGRDTLANLASPVFLETDSAILCPQAGLLLRGWFADPFGQVAAIHVRSGGRSARLDSDEWVAMARPDAAKSLRQTHGNIDDRCGFMAWVPGIWPADEPCAYEIETVAGQTVFRGLPPFGSAGLPAIKAALSVFDLRGAEMTRAYDHVIGPAVDAMNLFRLARQPDVSAQAFGAPPAAPDCSLVIPLHGRIDFMEYQLAFFARTLPPGTELIYVLDDPAQARAAEALAMTCLARFGRPFRLLALDRNVGFAPASNIGLAAARAPYVCFLNSDVFPKRASWLSDMLQTARTYPRAGIVGALLLFEDETVQHEGCNFAHLPEFGAWQFALHPNKGRVPTGEETIVEVAAVTGACLLMRTDLARELGGFDEGYVIGDFEDVDLCCKVRAREMVCVVDRRAQLYHLERQSQGGPDSVWRMNLTLFNAWRFQARWLEQAAA